MGQSSGDTLGRGTEPDPLALGSERCSCFGKGSGDPVWGHPNLSGGSGWLERSGSSWGHGVMGRSEREQNCAIPSEKPWPQGRSCLRCQIRLQ